MGAHPTPAALHTPNGAASVQALYFGPADARLAGWLHHASGPGAGVGLVICNPFGFEEVCAHRSLRHMAQAAAAAGVPALRFDYLGTGNSGDFAGEFLGGRPPADAWARWVSSVHVAVDHLRALTGVRRVVLLGVRLGAALAALAAAERDDIAGLATIAPVVRGRSYLRELRVLGAAVTEPTGVGDGWLESAGFALGPDFQASLNTLDVRALARAPAPRVLIVPRDDMPTADDWLPALRQRGAEVAVERWPGYGRMMEDPQRAQVPGRIVAGVVAWLKAGDADAEPLARPTAGPMASTPMPVGTPEGPVAIYEAVLRIPFGAGTLAAVLSAPQHTSGHDTSSGPSTPSTQGRPAVLMLNSGAVHLMGPNRLWVQLARRWAARGLVVLRLDLSGIGDSPAAPGAAENVVYSAQALRDIDAALAYLRNELGASRCQVMGLCSGAYHALKAAVSGPPSVVSAVMMNPLTYFWKAGAMPGDVKEYELFELSARYRRMLLTAEPWKRLLRGELDLRVIADVALRRVWKFASPRLLEWARWLHLPLRRDLARELRGVTARGTTMHFVFADGAPGYELLRRQAGRALGDLQREGRLSIDFIAEADHTFTRLQARERLVARLDALVLTAPP